MCTHILHMYLHDPWLSVGSRGWRGRGGLLWLLLLRLAGFFLLLLSLGGERGRGREGEGEGGVGERGMGREGEGGWKKRGGRGGV